MATPQDRRLTCRCTRARLHVVLSQIQVWFQNRRQRDRNILRTSTTDGTQAAPGWAPDGTRVGPGWAPVENVFIFWKLSRRLNIVATK